MSVQEQILEALRTEIDSLHSFAAVMYGPLDASECIVLIPDGGNPDEITLAHGGAYTMNLPLNAKHASHATVRETMQLIHEHLNKLSAYPSGANWAVTGISTLSAPRYIDREEQHWVYGSAITIQYVID